MTSSDHQLEEWYKHFLNISQLASDRAAFEIAYHSLVAALHCAKDLNDLPLMRNLLSEVERQRQSLDCTAPKHPLSTFSAAERGHESVYSTLENHIGALLRFREAERHFKNQGEDRSGSSRL